MALTKCKDCGREISDTARACPHCGAPPPKKTSLFTWVVGGLFALVLTQCVMRQAGREDRQVSKPALTPEQIAQRAKADEDLRRAVAATRVIKKSMKDPESFKLESFVYYDGGAVCVEFRAKNSFGAVVPGKGVFDGAAAILTNADGNRFVKVWNDTCTRPGGQDRAAGVNALGVL